MRQKNNYGKWGFFMILAIPFLLLSCYPGGPEYVEDMDLVATKYDSTFDFSKVNTYIMPDTVMPVFDPDHPEDADPINKQKQKLILDEMVKQLTQLGWERKFDTIDGYPDMYITLTAFTNTTVNYYYDYWYYWWGYYPYWPPYWGGGGYYPYYPWGGAYVYTYTTGTVLTQMMDPNNTADIEERIPVVWIGAINGLAEGTDQYINERIERGISQMFKQSPYLR
jgi:hypothetical protein